MQTTVWKLLAALLAVLIVFSATSACAPLLIGAGGAVVADEAIETNRAGTGCFRPSRRNR